MGGNDQAPVPPYLHTAATYHAPQLLQLLDRGRVGAHRQVESRLLALALGLARHALLVRLALALGIDDIIGSRSERYE